tara:strand:- start:360 stop:710 length:351 start_codon:yes stop_codon:yes gene_type:complete
MNINYRELYLNHQGAEVDSDWDGGYDYTMSAEFTADDYYIFLCRYEGEEVSIAEDIYYYPNNLLDVLKDKVDEGLKIYCDEEILDKCSVESEWENWCEEAGLIEWDDHTSDWKLAE